ncbi:hypothetical protein [Paractinoplanes brasiliensis]|uniref:Uncharacterized protein n=1 Tax=Paractinoplanes brasiliensis TaxID=52695 RepID=A0A4R6K032_9ACTN|nr:hypothetical protein [Actinoplanes brasiliensis]TDO40475.1 hypothetical protein C8E87_4189 [Actinoplanes brasiliensis]GID25543.1 hypothetical protein Abr02nite_05260 [Actinoplanes brasiliensis]
MTTVRYEIRVVGLLGTAARTAFSGLTVEEEPATTVLSGTLDQAGLHEVLDQIRALGLELVDVSQPGSPETAGETPFPYG